MEATLLDLSLTWGLATLLVALGGIGIAVLPWRAVQVAASSAAWGDLSTLSGGFARDGLRIARRGWTRLGEASGRRPTAALSRTLS